MSGGGGGVIIIKHKLKEAITTSAVLDQLGPNKRTRAEALGVTDVTAWTKDDTKFALHCVRDAYLSYE